MSHKLLVACSSPCPPPHLFVLKNSWQNILINASTAKWLMCFVGFFFKKKRNLLSSICFQHFNLLWTAYLLWEWKGMLQACFQCTWESFPQHANSPENMWNNGLETRKFLMPSTHCSEGFAVLWRSWNNLSSLLASLSLFYTWQRGMCVLLSF